MASSAVRYVVVAASSLSLLTVVVAVRESRRGSIPPQDCLYHFPSFDLPRKVSETEATRA